MNVMRIIIVMHICQAIIHYNYSNFIYFMAWVFYKYCTTYSLRVTNGCLANFLNKYKFIIQYSQKNKKEIFLYKKKLKKKKIK